MTQANEAITGLLEALSIPLSRNDLGRLAQMHSRGQVLAETEAPTDNPAANDALGRLARSLVLLMERIILDEAADADAGIALVPEMVKLLDQAWHGQAVQVDELLSQVDAAINGAGAPEPAPAPAAQAAPSPQPAQATPPAPAAPDPASPATPEPQAVARAPQPAPPTDKSTAAGDARYTSEPLVIDLSEREHLEGFLEEAAEHMDAIEAGLLEVETNLSDGDKLNELFRPFHTIKGIAGFLNLRDINRLTHEIETILDYGRKGELEVTTATVDLIFAAVDVLKAQLAEIGRYLANPTGDACPQPDIADIMAKLGRVASQQDAVPERPRLGEVMVESGGASTTDIEAALDIQSREVDPQRKLGEILVDEGVASDHQVQRALSQQQETARAATDSSIRVDTTKLDALVDAVGELVIAQSMVGLSEKIQEDDRLSRNVSQVTKIVRDVQETAMGMRMVPIGHTFQKMRRLVRDVSRKAGKDVELVINGEDTELDKNVIQQMSDPLVHLVRNAVDHGIESPSERRANGKPAAGRVQLNAYHQGDSIVIEIRDDGHGLDRDRLFAKGIERGLVSPEDQLSDQQIFALILQAGFSTAEKITDISGRGVGMDVVRRNVEQLRGKIEIHSEKGRGSCFAIRLPLTLAIIDGMLIRIGTERLIIPTILIEQSLQPERKQITSVQRRGEMLQIRGELCPLIQLGALFNYCAPVDPCTNLVVVAQCEGQKIALVVEELIGQQQVVIKTLGERFKGLEGISGAAILGDGRVGLILEPSGLLALHNAHGCEIYSSMAGNPASASVAEVTGTDMPTAPLPEQMAPGNEPPTTVEALDEAESAEAAAVASETL